MCLFFIFKCVCIFNLFNVSLHSQRVHCSFAHILINTVCQHFFGSVSAVGNAGFVEATLRSSALGALGPLCLDCHHRHHHPTGGEGPAKLSVLLPLARAESGLIVPGNR